MGMRDATWTEQFGDAKGLLEYVYVADAILHPGDGFQLEVGGDCPFETFLGERKEEDGFLEVLHGLCVSLLEGPARCCDTRQTLGFIDDLQIPDELTLFIFFFFFILLVDLVQLLFQLLDLLIHLLRLLDNKLVAFLRLN